MKLSYRLLITLCFTASLLSSTIAAHPCLTANKWIPIPSSKRHIIDEKTFFTKTMDCNADSKTNMRQPKVLCTIACGRERNGTEISLDSAIADHTDSLYYSESKILKKCTTHECFANICHSFLFHFKVKKYCGGLYQRALNTKSKSNHK